MGLNSRLFRLAVNRAVDPILVKEARELMEVEFDTKKEQVMEEFDGHAVTKELQGGETAFSSIPALAGVGGNLFSFLGFYRGEKPAEELRDYLDKSITLSPHRGRGKSVGNKLIYTAKTSFPTLDEVDRVMGQKLPLDWVSRSFTNLIAKGAPGLPNYLFRENPRFKSPDPSRSSTAIQTKSTLRGGSFGGVKYVSEIIGTLKRLFAQKRTLG
jgi:hypothetical protein